MSVFLDDVRTEESFEVVYNVGVYVYTKSVVFQG